MTDKLLTFQQALLFCFCAANLVFSEVMLIFAVCLLPFCNDTHFVVLVALFHSLSSSFVSSLSLTNWELICSLLFTSFFIAPVLLKHWSPLSSISCLLRYFFYPLQDLNACQTHKRTKSPGEISIYACGQMHCVLGMQRHQYSCERIDVCLQCELGRL